MEYTEWFINDKIRINLAEPDETCSACPNKWATSGIPYSMDISATFTNIQDD
jgi:hypothetical protein